MLRIKLPTLGRLAAMFPVIMVFLFIIVSLVKVVVFRDYSGCWYRFQIIERTVIGKVSLIDTVQDRSGVGFYVKNDNVMESYRVYSDTLVQMYRNGQVNVGDMIIKYPQTRYGYVVSQSGSRYYIELLDEWYSCDSMSARSRDSIIRKFPVDFSD